MLYNCGHDMCRNTATHFNVLKYSNENDRYYELYFPSCLRHRRKNNYITVEEYEMIVIVIS